MAKSRIVEVKRTVINKAFELIDALDSANEPGGDVFSLITNVHLAEHGWDSAVAKIDVSADIGMTTAIVQVIVLPSGSIAVETVGKSFDAKSEAPINEKVAVILRALTHAAAEMEA